MPRSSSRKRSARRPKAAPRLGASLKRSLREAVTHRGASLDTLRDAICAFAADLNAKGMNAADIAAGVREAVLDLRAAGTPLATQLADADPSLDQTVLSCLGFSDGSANPLRTPDVGPGEAKEIQPGSGRPSRVADRRRRSDRRRIPTRLRGP